MKSPLWNSTVCRQLYNIDSSLPFMISPSLPSTSMYLSLWLSPYLSIADTTANPTFSLYIYLSNPHLSLCLSFPTLSVSTPTLSLYPSFSFPSLSLLPFSSLNRTLSVHTTLQPGQWSCQNTITLSINNKPGLRIPGLILMIYPESDMDLEEKKHGSGSDLVFE